MLPDSTFMSTALSSPFFLFSHTLSLSSFFSSLFSSLSLLFSRLFSIIIFLVFPLFFCLCFFLSFALAPCRLLTLSLLSPWLLYLFYVLDLGFSVSHSVCVFWLAICQVRTQPDPSASSAQPSSSSKPVSSIAQPASTTSTGEHLRDSEHEAQQ